MAESIEGPLQRPEVRDAWRQAVEATGRQALELLAEEISAFDRSRLFGEVPQSAVYIAPTLKCVESGKLKTAEID